MFKSRLIFGAKLLVGGLVLALLIRSLRPGQLWQTLLTANITYLAAAALMLIPNLGIQIVKWRFLLRTANPAQTFASARDSLLIGYPLALVTPGRLGEIGRAFFVSGIDRKQTLKLAVLDKLATALIITVAGAAGLCFLFRESVTPALLLPLIGGLVGMLSVPAFSSQPGAAIRKFAGIPSFTKKDTFILFGASFLFYLIFVGQFLLLLLSFQPVAIGTTVPAVAATFFAKTALPFAIGDLGIREGAAVFFLKRVAVDSAAAFNAAFALFLINIAIPTLLSLPLFFKMKLDPTKRNAP